MKVLSRINKSVESAKKYSTSVLSTSSGISIAPNFVISKHSTMDIIFKAFNAELVSFTSDIDSDIFLAKDKDDLLKALEKAMEAFDSILLKEAKKLGYKKI